MNMMRYTAVLFLAVLSATTDAPAGEADGAVPRNELQALDTAIRRELNRNELGSTVLGDLQRLRHRLETMAPVRTERASALEPLGDGDDLRLRLLARLEEEAQTGNRNALRSLGLYQLFLGTPEPALAAWRRMGKTNAGDIPFLLVSAYLELALGEFASARANLETAQRLMEARTGLELSPPVLCRTIAGYRLYDPRPPKDVEPGEITLLYIEIEGADFQPLADGDSECRLMFGLKLTDSAGRTVWMEPNFGEYNPAFTGPIRDLHTALTWRAPPDLSPGVHRLHVEAVEPSSKRRGESFLEFTVGSRPTNPLKRPTGMAAPDAEAAARNANPPFLGGQEFFDMDKRLRQNWNDREFEILKMHEQMQRGDK